MKLARTQAALYELIVSEREPDAGVAGRIVRRLPPLTPAQRVQIYGQQYPARMHESLSEDFPALAKLLGDKGFERFVKAYARAHPSEHHDLGHFGRKVVPFLRRKRFGRADLAELAELEWTRSQVFFDADAVPVARDALASVAPEAFPRVRLAMIPALRVLSFPHSVLPLWRALEDGHRVPRPAKRPSHAVVWRQGFEVFHASLTAEEAAAMRLAIKGRPLAAVMMPFAKAPQGAQAAFKALATWVSEGMVASVRS